MGRSSTKKRQFLLDGAGQRWQIVDEDTNPNSPNQKILKVKRPGTFPALNRGKTVTVDRGEILGPPFPFRKETYYFVPGYDVEKERPVEAESTIIYVAAEKLKQLHRAIDILTQRNRIYEKTYMDIMASHKKGMLEEADIIGKLTRAIARVPTEEVRPMGFAPTISEEVE